MSAVETRTDSRPPMRGPFARWPRLADGLLCLTVLACNLLFTDTQGDVVIRPVNDLPLTSILLFAAASIALYWRRQHPLPVLGVSLVVIALQTVLGDPNSVWALPFAIYAVGRYADDNRWSVRAVATTIALITVSSLVQNEPLFNIGFAYAFLFLIWYVGKYIGVRGDYLRLLELRAVQLEREQAVEARRAVSEERTRIARELHDVVAHRVSLMTIQAGAAKTVVGKNPAAALQAMGAVESAGRQALDELRHLLGVLRPDNSAAAMSPQPGIEDIQHLAGQMREAGIQVTLNIEGDSQQLPAPVALSTFRIVQEAMTNVLKHAGPGVEAQINIRVSPTQVNIRVSDNGNGVTQLPGTGHGIVGMRERAQLLGGHLQARPREPQGFEVMANLPFEQVQQ